MSLDLEHVSHGRLSNLSLSLEPGLHVVVAGPSDGLEELLALSAGDMPPRRGSVTLNGKSPAKDHQLRASIGCAFVDEVFEEALVSNAVASRLKLHAEAITPEAAFEHFGATHLLGRRCRTLTWYERRSISLILALALKTPTLILLHEPLLAADSPLPLDTLLETLRERSRTGIVLCTTQSTRQAALLSPQSLLLEQGQLRRAVMAPTRPALTPGSPARVVVESQQAARLVQALGGHESLSAITRSNETTLVLEGPRVEAICQAVWAAAHEHAVLVSQLRQELPEVVEIRASHAALARASYERTYGVVSTAQRGNPT